MTFGYFTPVPPPYNPNQPPKPAIIPTIDIDIDVERLLRRLGVTRKLRGFPYTVYMVEKLREDPEAIHLITKRLYRETAEQFGVSDTAVERNVRTMVRRCWARPDHSLLEHIAGGPLSCCPTNAEFLDMMADFLRRAA